jgi:hypothetical protein
MSGDLKRRHERAVSDSLLSALGITASFDRPGDDHDEPDMIYILGSGETLGIEVATAYYSDDAAKADWTLARGVRPPPPDGVEVGPMMAWPDDRMCERVQNELVDKCGKTYSGVDHVWLCIRADAPLADRAAMCDCIERLHVPTGHAFEAIYMTYTVPEHEGGSVEAVVLAGGPGGVGGAPLRAARWTLAILVVPLAVIVLGEFAVNKILKGRGPR